MTYANVAVTIAFVFAMSGGAYAASKILITSTKQISPKVLAALKGKTGPAGPIGAAGPAGPTGATGPAGAKGEVGASGNDGANGEKGATGPTGSTGSTGPAGAKGATGPAGQPGPQGPAGEPWTPNSTLPKNATETGVWVENKPETEGATVRVPISFPIQVEAGTITGHFLKVNESTEECPGTREKPEAKTGNLCVWPDAESTGVHAEFVTFVDPSQALALGIDPAGTLLLFKVSAGATAMEGQGTWAVTG